MSITILKTDWNLELFVQIQESNLDFEIENLWDF